jgi:hypothetical protein
MDDSLIEIYLTYHISLGISLHLAEKRYICLDMPFITIWVNFYKTKKLINIINFMSKF